MSTAGSVRLAGFQHHKIVVVQSLEPHERQTGQELADFLHGEVSARGLNTPVSLHYCEGFRDFLVLLETLAEEAHEGEIPLLQIECHGDPNTGLEFANGSELSWDDLSKALFQLNIATRFNLLTIVSACFGAHFIGRFAPVGPAPCYALISPTEEVTPFELRNGLQAFYREFFASTDLGVAERALSAFGLQEGRWFSMAAEAWFEFTVRGYLENNCSRRASIDRARALNQRLRESGRPERSQRVWFDIFRHENDRVVLRLFMTFFSVGLLPENMDRFEACYSRSEARLARIRARGTHIL